VTVRNLRQLQTHGVLQPPDLVGRKGFYGERHFARVSVVHHLQWKGYSIAAIRDVLDKWQADGGKGSLEGLEGAVGAPFPPKSRSLGKVEIMRLVPDFSEDPALVERARAAGVIEGEGSGLRARNAELLQIARKLSDLGIPFSVMLELVSALRPSVNGLTQVARRFFQDNVLEPFYQAGMPSTELAHLGKIVTLMREFASHAVILLLGEAFTSVDRIDGTPAPAKARRARKTRRRT
jgi:DNA-binding transcriptional MerR regulator